MEFKGPITQMVGFRGPKTIQGIDFGTSNLALWVLGRSGFVVHRGLRTGFIWSNDPKCDLGYVPLQKRALESMNLGEA